MAKTGEPANSGLTDFVNALAICHTIIVEDKNGVLVYNASSPDELALTNAARHFGRTFCERDENSNILVRDKFTGAVVKYEVLDVIEFTSNRKRMSVTVRTPDNKILCIVKGADTTIIPRLAKGQEELVNKTQEFLTGYACDGLRTLIVAQKEVDPAFYSKWSKDYNKALTSVAGRQEKIEKVGELIETGLTLVGSTAIEDKLQEDVGDVIEFIKAAGIKLWVLTGDKIETAVNIGFSCKLLDAEMEIFIIDKVSTRDIYTQICDFIEKSEKIGVSRDCAVVIGGDALAKIQKNYRNKKLLTQFLRLMDKATSVLCCRVSPIQKAEIVKMIIKAKDVTTLAIGDGANDVNMITSAHIGVGISGLEGQQACRASDYSIG